MKSRSVITVGNFDGVHVGHRALLREAGALARASGAVPVVAMAFRKHPLTFLKPQAAPGMLLDEVQREARLREAGADRVEWIEPDEKTLGQSPEQFVAGVVERFNPVGWVEGPDFRFGKGRAGDVQTLRELGSRHGFEVRIVEPVTVVLADKSECAVSSTLVRWLVAHGRVADARLCLARPLAIRGIVVTGDRRGKELGYPTVNLDTGGRLLPGDGVYAGRTTLDGRSYPAAISVGTKPMFAMGEQRTFEAHILGFEGDLYGQTLEVEVTRWLRDQQSFPGVQGLIEQMGRDVARVKEAA